MKDTVRRDVVLEFVNTQIGWLSSVIKRCADEDIRDSLQQLLNSMKGLKRGLETGEWPGVVI